MNNEPLSVDGERRLYVENGKYTFILRPGDWRIHVLRHCEPWLVIEQGSKALHGLIWEAIEAQNLVAAVERWATPTTAIERGELHRALHAAWCAYKTERGEPQPPPAIACTDGWRRDDPPRGRRCLVTRRTPDSLKPSVLIASVSEDFDDVRWFHAGARIHNVIAWMPLPEPASDG